MTLSLDEDATDFVLDIPDLGIHEVSAGGLRVEAAAEMEEWTTTVPGRGHDPDRGPTLPSPTTRRRGSTAGTFRLLYHVIAISCSDSRAGRAGRCGPSRRSPPGSVSATPLGRTCARHVPSNPVSSLGNSIATAHEFS